MIRPADPKRHKIGWVDRGHPPNNSPDPRFPNGIDIVAENAGIGEADPTPHCKVILPYPTGRKNVGGWQVDCQQCRLRVYVTAASRPDDPRSIVLPCTE